MKNCDDCGEPLPNYCAQDIVCYPCATRYTSRGLQHPAWHREDSMKERRLHSYLVTATRGDRT